MHEGSEKHCQRSDKTHQYVHPLAIEVNSMLVMLVVDRAMAVRIKLERVRM